MVIFLLNNLKYDKMKNKPIKPNASLLTILSKTIENKEVLIFCYLKQLNDRANVSKDKAIKEYWIKIGQNIWQKNKIKQWLVIGEDDHINKLFDDLL